MSYILDALRRADAEREVGAVPSIYAQPVPLGLADDAYAMTPARPWWWVTVLVLLLAGLVAWLLMRGEEPAPQPAAVVASPAPAPPLVDVPPVVSAPVDSAPAVSPPDVPTESSPVQHKIALPTPSRALPKPPVSAARVPTAKPILALSELPDAVRQVQPTLTVGGAMYSADATSRMLILNGQVLHEGDSVAPDLVLEKINLKSAVLVYKGYRYSINY